MENWWVFHVYVSLPEFFPPYLLDGKKVMKRKQFTKIISPSVRVPFKKLPILRAFYLELQELFTVLHSLQLTVCPIIPSLVLIRLGALQASPK